MNKGILIILDGYGEGKPYEFNAVTNAKTPTLDRLKSQSYSLLEASGEAVGLFDGDLGGSEVGHTTIGAGRIVPSTAKRINDDLNSGEFRNNEELNKVLTSLKMKNNLHLVGLLSDKNIHSNLNHALEIIDMAKDSAKNIFFHIITDGRDTGAYDSKKYLNKLLEHTKDIKNFHILSVSGRFYAMDRENHLERTEEAINAMLKSDNAIDVEDLEKYISVQHDMGYNDQYIQPKHINCKKYTKITKNDVILFYNFREDRLRQIVKASENYFVKIVTMSEVSNVKSIVLYPEENIENTLSQYLSESNLRQIKISESTKYAHVTYFMNGGREVPFRNEDRVHIPSLNVDDFAKTPKMQAGKITKEIINAIKNQYDAIIVNFSNPDMIGHTGDYEATKTAIEYLDKCLAKILKVAKKKKYFTLVTADHGNSEEMRKDNEPQLAHTLNPVFCVVADSGLKMKRKGGLRDIAPTFVDLLGLDKCKFFEGKSLIKK